MSLDECYAILEVDKNADQEEIKGAFRRLAFKLHPDLTPAQDAAGRFRRLNEAYVLLRQNAGPGGPGPNQEARTRPDLGAEAYRRQQRQAGPTAERRKEPRGFGPSFEFKDEEVLKDILKDPFARKVFEDIFSQIKRSRPGFRPAKSALSRELRLRWGGRVLSLDFTRGILNGLKSWFRGQLDHEQTVRFPANNLIPGRQVRITVHRRFSKGPKTVEFTLPPDFVPGRPIRLKGLGRRLGPARGDLLLRIIAK
ncbi:MAG: DnaJ domain-containing protein [Desulfovibrionaceae bacterium]|nr:DnaJ domain-containing protein [Desulfovibrionaceae bacterium]